MTEYNICKMRNRILHTKIYILNFKFQKCAEISGKVLERQSKNPKMPTGEIEVKAEENLKAKSLKVYSEKYTPAISIRSSMSDYRHDEWLLNLPLYGISQILAECEKLI